MPKYQQDDEKDHGSCYRLVGQSLGVSLHCSAAQLLRSRRDHGSFEARRVALGPEKFKALEVGRVAIRRERRESELAELVIVGKGDYEICLRY